MRSGKGKRPEDYVAPPMEELAKLRKVTPVEEPRTLSTGISAALTSLGMGEEPAESRRNSGRRRRRSGGEQQAQQPRREENRPAQKTAQPKPQQRPRTETKHKAETKPVTEKPAAEGQQGGEKKRPRRRYHRKPRGDKPQNPGT